MATSRVLPLVDGDVAEIGPYRVLGRLGAGGMGIVYACEGRDGRRVAVKAVRAEIAGDPSFRARFRREVDLLRRVTGPCLVPLLDADTDTARPWLATEYVAGPTLHDHLARHGALPGATLTALAAGVADALHRVHAAGVVHRDLKPGNVVLASDGPRVLDFGIARVLDETAITRTGGWTGTPGWTSPEEYRGDRGGTAADVFAWGALVAYAATGRLPFGSGAPDAVAYRIMREEADTAGVPAGLLPLVRAALDKDPARRPAAAELVGRCLILLSAGTPPGGGGTTGGDALESALAAHWRVPYGPEAPHRWAGGEPVPPGDGWDLDGWDLGGRGFDGRGFDGRTGWEARGGPAPDEEWTVPGGRRPGRPRLLAAVATLVLLAGGGVGYTVVNQVSGGARESAGGAAAPGAAGPGNGAARAVPPAGGTPGAAAPGGGTGGAGAAGDVGSIDPGITVSGAFGTRAVLTVPDRPPRGERFAVRLVSAGDGRVVRRQDRVTVDYTAVDWTEGRAVPSSYDPGERPQLFQAGADQVIGALEHTVIGRRVGSRLLVVAPPAEAFGRKGSPGLGVGPGATMVFVLDITSAVRPGAAGTGSASAPRTSSG
ncbi:protein kinase [Streptacidiphilus sp. ASG 303]|uniref:protein kinase domain-containing protein n=1 Tax=Streptacidiphilus sp. ASG 303 TaxID=2896847 RepID=UPI001E410C13|nr:protein kinase [Streptacidiphilus sp. ASG 303]MCD0483403.1 protein kinase [Streptacidiphilus sp. ASG 303]